MRWLCFGAGAVGTYIGGSLALQGETVNFIERPGTAAELSRRGLRLEMRGALSSGLARTHTVSPDQVGFFGSLDEALRQASFDAAIYALKSFDTAAAVAEMTPLSKHMPPLICFSNGVQNEAELARALGEDRVVPATITTSIARNDAGDIVVERLRGIGIAASHPLSRQIEVKARIAGLNPALYGHAAAMKWSKMLTNLIANPTSAILDMAPTEVLHHAGIYRLEIRMLRECLAVMRAKRIGVVDLPKTPVRALALAAQLPPLLSKPVLARAAGAGRGGKMPSFHIDLHSGRGRSEVEFLHGAVVEAGNAAGVPTPANAFLTRTLVALTRGELDKAEYRRKPEKLLDAFQAWQSRQ